MKMVTKRDPYPNYFYFPLLQRDSWVVLIKTSSHPLNMVGYKHIKTTCIQVLDVESGPMDPTVWVIQNNIFLSGRYIISQIGVFPLVL
jgi:hypothetical protein